MKVTGKMLQKTYQEVAEHLNEALQDKPSRHTHTVVSPGDGKLYCLVCGKKLTGAQTREEC